MTEKDIKNLSIRLFDLLDTYEARDTDTTPETIFKDLLNDPYNIIKWLVEYCEDLTA